MSTFFFLDHAVTLDLLQKQKSRWCMKVNTPQYQNCPKIYLYPGNQGKHQNLLVSTMSICPRQWFSNLRLTNLIFRNWQPYTQSHVK